MAVGAHLTFKHAAAADVPTPAAGKSNEFIETTTGAKSVKDSTGAVTTLVDSAALALKANIASPTFTGTPAAPTAADGTNTTQLATTGFVQAAITALRNGVSSAFDTLIEIATELGLKAPIASPTFTGTPAAPTAAPGTNTTQIATTAFVDAAVGGAAVSSLDDVGDVNAPTPANGDVLTWDSTPGEWVAAAPAGGGGGSVSGSIDLYVHKAPEASPSSLDDDFNSSTLNAKYALVNMASNITYDVDTTKPGALYMDCTAADQVIHAVLDTIPAGDFVYQTRLHAACTVAGNAFFGLVLADGATAGSGNQRIQGLSFEGAQGRLLRKFYNWSGFNAAGSGSGANEWSEYSAFIRARRVGTTIYHDISPDGRLWENITSITEASLGWTVTRCGPGIRNGAGGSTQLAFDYIRYHATSTTPFGKKLRLALTT